MYILREVYRQIRSTIGNLEPECGGIIAMDQDGIISDFYFDIDAGFGKVSYVPSRTTLQNYVRDIWKYQNLHFCGVVHSHPFCNRCEPSNMDIKMALKIMELNNIKDFYLLMVKGDEIKLYRNMNENGQSQCHFKEEKMEILDVQLITIE